MDDGKPAPDQAEWLWWRRQLGQEAARDGRTVDDDESRRAFRRGLTPRAAACLMPLVATTPEEQP